MRSRNHPSYRRLLDVLVIFSSSSKHLGGKKQTPGWSALVIILIWSCATKSRWSEPNYVLRYHIGPRNIIENGPSPHTVLWMYWQVTSCWFVYKQVVVENNWIKKLSCTKLLRNFKQPSFLTHTWLQNTVSSFVHNESPQKNI